MPVNKNAMTRYKILDELLSNKYQNYSLDDLTDKVNLALAEIEVSSVSRRCIEKDIHYLEYESEFFVEIERYSVDALRGTTEKPYKKKCLRYADTSCSIFKKNMTDDEKHILSETLSLLGQFDGLPHLEALDDLRKSLGVNNPRNIISFTKNPLENSNLLGELFTMISNKKVLEIKYHTLFDETQQKSFTIHPYLLKEYNNRWYLFACAENNNKLLSFSLDRITKITPSSIEYKECQLDLNEHFEDIIGVTLYDNAKLEKIVFWVSDKSKYYVKTKPLHESQIHFADKDNKLQEQYPMLEGGFFFSIECRKNYELIRELTSFGEDLLVLSPKNIQNEIYNKLTAQIEGYNKLRT
ncbi:MAG: WYL domain-containing protein [bacterium]